MSLLVKAQKGEHIQHITPQIAGWHHIGFDVCIIKQGQNITIESGDRELCLVLVSGLASISTREADFPGLGQRLSPFERTPPWSVYVPPQDNAIITADADLELAICSAPGRGTFPARVIRPEEVGVERRGAGRNQRLVHNILPDSAPAECLLVVEVYTEEGATSSWPSHKHDTALPGQETQLEETYYHRFDPPQGFAFQRVYTDDRSLDVCMAPYNHDVVMVPRGYHPVATIAGYSSYYLNVMAGPERKWLFSWEEDHAWINGGGYPRRE
ncbi:5-deoxy-glucuronate isomerase [Intestinirhabdus alba]|jgi:5-deoxy-glucuronate isomerase|uniref:5-deoxy-glucuronate isomerase n=1 Tax=Intestinirhabdus alba TaxID=2899544 RepID=A0A6L6IS74_9ENTR|nr:5-deoxy-glucuronate isomerase [Intestinirhabdus alba]MTH47860.1 5-deoxy-glucuronate isomerase [Intestinirhabdus alba]